MFQTRTVPVIPTRSQVKNVAEPEERTVLLGELTDEDWATSTICPGWTVKDIALHLAPREV